MPTQAIYNTQNTFEQGDHKIHLLDESSDKCLCGYEPGFYFEVDYRNFYGSLDSYISQPDPDGNLCKRCIRIYRKRQSTRKADKQ